MDNNSVINIATALELQPDTLSSSSSSNDDLRRTALTGFKRDSIPRNNNNNNNNATEPPSGPATATTSAGTTGITRATRPAGELHDDARNEEIYRSFYFPDRKRSSSGSTAASRPQTRTNPSSLTSSPVSLSNSIKSFPSPARPSSAASKHHHHPPHPQPPSAPLPPQPAQPQVPQPAQPQPPQPQPQPQPPQPQELIRPRPSIDDLMKPGGSAKSSASSSSNSSSSRPTADSTKTKPKKKKGFTIMYKKDPLASSGRTSSRYYERMGSRSWLPSINTKRTSSMLIPHVAPEEEPKEEEPIVETPSTVGGGSGGRHSASPSSQVSSCNSGAGTPPYTPEWPNFAYPRTSRRPASQTSSGRAINLRPSHPSSMRSQVTNDNDYDSKQSTNNHSHPLNHARNNNTNNSTTKLSFSNEACDEDAAEMIGAVPPLSLYTHVPRIFGEEPPQISGHTCVLVKNKLFIYGGKTGDGYSTSLYVFNCITSTLAKAATSGEAPPMVLDATATLVRHKYIYYFGGMDAKDRCRNDLYTFNTATMTFARAPLEPQDQRRPCPRRGHSTVAHDNTLFVFGGFDSDGEALNDVWRFDMANSAWSEVLSLDKDTAHWPAARGNHSAHVAQPGNASSESATTKTMVVYGGNDATTVFGDVWIFDFERARWSALGDTVVKPDPNTPLPSSPDDSPVTTSPPGSRKRTLHSAHLSGKYLMVVGGHDGSDTVSTLDILNLLSRRWTIRQMYGLQSLGPCYHSGILYDSRYYIVGGFDMNQILVGLQVIEIPMFPCVAT